MGGGETYPVFAVDNSVIPTVELRQNSEASETLHLQQIVDTNGDGLPSSGDYGITTGGSTYCIALTGTVLYHDSGELISWDRLNRRHSFQPTNQVEFRGAEPTPFTMAVEETALMVPRYLEPQVHEGKHLTATYVSDHPVAVAVGGGLFAVGIVYAQVYPAGKVATLLQWSLVGGMVVSTSGFVQDRAEVYVPAGVALAQGDVTQAENIVLGGTMGEQDFLQIPAMLCGVTAAETTLSRAIGWMSGGGGSGRFVLAGKAVIWSELTDKIVTRIFLANGERMRKAFDLWRQGGGPSLPPAGERTEQAFVAWLIGWDVKISLDGTLQIKTVEEMLLHKTYAEIFIGFLQRGLSIEGRVELTAAQRQFTEQRFRDPLKIADELEGWVTIRNVAYALLGRPIP